MTPAQITALGLAQIQGEELRCDGCDKPLPRAAKDRYLSDRGAICGRCAAPELARRTGSDALARAAIAGPVRS